MPAPTRQNDVMRPLVVAHRGSSAALPEHTLAAYERAIEEGADAVECDVRLTADGEIVCIHDRTLDRTSNGKGVVSAMTLAQLREFDFGSWHASGSRAKVLTLRELLDLLVSTDRKVGLVLETKHPTRYFGRIEHAVKGLLEEYQLLEPSKARTPVRLISFSVPAVHRFGRLMPNLERVQLVDGPQARRFAKHLPEAVHIAGPGIGVLRADPDFAQRHHDAGHTLHVWTADDPADIQLCIDLGVESITTNRPTDVLAALGR